MDGGLLLDYFAGGGGASEGLEEATGRAVDVAVNHDPEAIAMHEANHPHTRHLCQSVYVVDPLEATGGRWVLGAWFSPDCKHFSIAKGGKPLEKNIRDLAWVVVRAIHRLGPARRPRVIWLENVVEFRTWGPLRKGRPCKKRKGRTFEQWADQLRRAGYTVEYRELKASDFGVPTSRTRFYLVARCDGLPIEWPEPTHGKPGSPGVLSGRLLPWRTAGEHVIDWSIPIPSIFGRKKELVEATKRRIGVGVWRYVVNAERRFFVPEGAMAGAVPHLMTMRNAAKPHAGADEPLHTVTANGAHKYVVAAFLSKYRPDHQGQSLHEPAPAVTANSFIKRPGGAPPMAIVCAHLEQANSGMVGHSAYEPVSTIVGRGCTQRLIATSLVKLRGTSTAQGADEPLHTISAGGGRGGGHFAAVAAFLVKYYGSHKHGQAAGEPLDAVTSLARFALVTVKVDGEDYVIVDIGMRMLTPRELARAQGFPDSYILDPEVETIDKRGRTVRKRLTKAAQIRMIGNSVCPPVAAAIVRATLGIAAEPEAQAA